ncbi:MAG: SCO family protein [Thiohalocapsa sp.]|nr:SCO family protein [Thiohalocapsa sp.]MCF7991712.1 SCO family protein [Thiohalocapsa sp.]
MKRMLPLAVVAALSLLLVWLAWFWQPGGEGEPPAHRSLDLAEQPRGGDFTLQSSRGPVSLSDLRGKVVLLYFGYTWCPDICPTNLAIIGLALKQLTPAERERVQALFVSVDPARDDTARLATFAEYFDASILGLTGSEEAIAEAAASYGAAYRKSDAGDSAMGYMVDHSSYVYVIDAHGELVATLEHATPAERIAAEVRARLAER